MDMSNLEEELRRLRRDLHKYPENGWNEFRTSSLIAEILSSLGFSLLLGREIINPEYLVGRPNEKTRAEHVERALRQGAKEKWLARMNGYTGVVGVLDTKKAGPTIALRFDIDANDLLESDSLEHRPYQEGFSSQNEGIMHACGHDGHTAIGLGLASKLKTKEEELRGKIILIFQPAEEGAKGAKAIVEQNVLDEVDYFLSGHLGFNIPTGEIIINPTGFLCSKKFDVLFTGKSAHAGLAPQAGNNALLAAATAILNMHAIAPHQKGMTRINVGTLQAGEARNIIPDKALLKVETRGETEELNEYIYQKALKILEHAASMYECKLQLTDMGETLNFDNDQQLIELAGKIFPTVEEIKSVKSDFIFGASEDVSFMMRRVQERGGKGIFLLLGADLSAGHHNCAFDFDERSLLIGVNLYYRMIEELSKLEKIERKNNTCIS